MSIQVLVATTHQENHDLLVKMNIQSDALIANQCSKNEIEEFTYNGNEIKYLSFAERGVGLNRNNALMRANADICILADDDLVYIDGYADKVEQLFKDNPLVDVMIFNLIEKPNKRYVIQKKFKVKYHNYMRFGAARIAFRRESITKNGIMFNLHFGGGAEFSAGEDTIFLQDCIKKRLNIIAVPEYIATLSNDRESTWFRGYTDKYFIDRGALFACLSRRWAKLLCIQFAFRHRKLYKENKTQAEVIRLMNKGIKEVNK